MTKRNILTSDERRRYQAAQVRLFAYLRDRGIRQRWLAKRLGITEAMVSHYVHRGDEMPLYRFEEACRALEVSPERFGWESRNGARSKSTRQAKRAS